LYDQPIELLPSIIAEFGWQISEPRVSQWITVFLETLDSYPKSFCHAFEYRVIPGTVDDAFPICRGDEIRLDQELIAIQHDISFLRE